MGFRSKISDFLSGGQLSRLQAELSEMRTFQQDVLSGALAWPFPSAGGIPMNRETAMRISTWFTCLQVRWDSVGMLPFNIFQVDGRSKTIAATLPAYNLLHSRPNPYMTATQFWKLVQMKSDNHGNAFAPITRDRRGQPVRIDLVNDSSAVQCFPGQEMYYRYNNQDISSADMLHFKGLTFDGRIGLSLTEYHAATIGRLKGLHIYSARSVKQNPGIYATTSNNQPMKLEGKTSFKDYWRREMEDFENGDMPVLYNGYDLKTVGIVPKDVMYLDQIKATKEDIYGITKVPPKLAQNYNAGQTYNNSEQQSLDFLTWTLSILLKDKEDECNYKLFTEEERAKYLCKFNEKALLRTDAKTQAAWLESMTRIGIYSINDGRETLDENPIEGGDQYLVDGNNKIPLSMLEDYVKSRTTGKAAAPAAAGTRVNGHSHEVA